MEADEVECHIVEPALPWSVIPLAASPLAMTLALKLADGGRERMGELLIGTVALLLIGLAFLWLMGRRRRGLRLPAGESIYEDTQEWPGEVLYSRQHDLNGKPDFLFQQGAAIIPVEVKMGKTPSRPYLGHIMQLMAYCVLVEANYSVRPDYGIIRYPEREFTIDFTPEREAALVAILTDMRKKKKPYRIVFVPDPYTARSRRA